MDRVFKNDEKLFKAVYPPEVEAMFWRRDGSVSSAAFADPKGLSVDRQGDRSDREAVADISHRLSGRIIFVRYRDCVRIGALVRHLPSKNNRYHCEIHGGERLPLLSKPQRRFLSQKATEIGIDIM